MKFLGILFFITLLFPVTAVACPTGMQFNGNGCSPPYEYTGWDLMRDRRAAIDAIGSDRAPVDYGKYLKTPEQMRELEEARKQREKEDEKKRQALSQGIWNIDSTATPEGNLCAATFAKYTSNINDGVIGGVITIMGFQQPKPDAWLIFQGVKLPKPKSVKKMKITLQQDDEPAQTLQVFNYRETRDVGTIMFAVPGLTAMLNGMSDTQRFRLSDNGKMLLDIEWHNAAPIIKKLKQCAK
ncbi:hypothetical protein [Acinetobacter sp. NIPH 298]|uniref:hypothetical protein n=1 Tax=Acinetobacter sp. NIPH 298 TaxID=1217692 RepID=UPI0002CE02C9|nr:hypothetical protein [Acinetobacter sp. NIPH 298]ENW97080.1 hypothetical protein F903_00901 [Acinetobacter sp. NIPH 298]